jgi:tetratricopeptide (TPR) repeat protein
MIEARHSVPRLNPLGTLSALAGILAIVAATGCVSVNHLRDAQESFNQAAAAENALRLDSTTPLDASGSGTLATWSSARNGYASALRSLEQLEAADRQRLRQDGLWGATLTLKALSEWRLGFFDEALATAAEARETAAEQIYPRDQALLRALPGLIKTDQAYHKILRGSPLPEVEALLIGGNGAISDIQSARDLAETDHPLHLYLLQARLAAYRNFQVALDRLQDHATVPVDHSARLEANADLKELDRLLKTRNTGPEGGKLVDYWATLCALDPP